MPTSTQTRPRDVQPIYVGVETAARLLSLSIFTIYKELAAGRMRGYQPGGKKGRWLIKVTDLEAWVEGRVAQSVAALHPGEDLAEPDSVLDGDARAVQRPYVGRTRRPLGGERLA